MIRTLSLGIALCILLSAASVGAQAESVEPFREPNLAALKTLLLPGWGQFDNDQPNKGWFLAVNAVVALLFGTEIVSFATDGPAADLEKAIAWIDYGLGAAFGAYDAFVHADRLNRENGYLLDEAARGLQQDVRPGRVVLFQRRF